MPVNPNRAYFFEALKTRTFTLEQIQETFNVGSSTARNWVARKDIEVVPNTWPYEYKLAGNTFLPQGVDPASDDLHKDCVPKKDHHRCLTGMPVATDAQLQESLDAFFDDEIKFDVGDKLKQVDSPESAQKLIDQLMSAIVMVQYYQDKLR